MNDIIPTARTNNMRKRRSEAVYHAIKRAILLHDLAPGTPLLEADLASEMDCSQGTVREALMRLHQDGLVSRRGYRGTLVSATSTEEAALLADIRLKIETSAAAGAARSGDREGFALLGSIVQEMRERDGQFDRYALSELDQEFHRTVLRIAGFDSLEPILTRCMLHIHRHTVGSPERRINPQVEGAAAAHQTLLETIRDDGPEKAAEAAREHVEAVVRRWSPDVWKILPRQ